MLNSSHSIGRLDMPMPDSQWQAAGPALPCFDPAALDKIVADPAHKAEILNDFLADTRADLAELEEALERNDFPASTRLAHCIKGASAMVGAYDLAAKCAEIERAGKNNIPMSGQDVRESFDGLTAYLAEFTDADI
jgi:HPt (histidine-containing phosphotransfer) domain-containing protein